MKRLLFTGASGFLGNNVKPLLDKEYEVKTVGISNDDDYKVDLSKEVPELDCPSDVVLHATGKAHVIPKSEEEKQSFYSVNYVGTIHLCDALEKVGVPKCFVFISTVAVYGRESGEMIDESCPLEGSSPYADSKRLAEEYLLKWCSNKGVNLTILRPSLIAGHNAPGNLGAMAKAIKKGLFFNVASGKAKKSVLMADDIARLIPLVENKSGVFNVCDSYNPSFTELSATIARQLRKPKPLNIPYWMAKCAAILGDVIGPQFPLNTLKLNKMTQSLTFSNEKARRELGWEPLDVLTNYKI